MSVETTETPDDVRAALDGVYDPELDRSLTELGFVDGIEIDNGSVTVSLRLPTGLCSPAFAWLMATDARDAVEALPGVETARIELRDHVVDEAISNGVNERASFEATFEDADGDLAALRWTFDHKARMGRQYDAIEALLDAGVTPPEIVSLTHGDIETGEHTTVTLDGREVAVPAEPIADYIEKVAALGIDQSADAPLFVDPDEEAISPNEFGTVHRLTRLSNTNMDGHAHHCSLLLDARYGE